MAGEHDITGLLMEWSRGNPEALDHLTRLVYQGLRRLAKRHLRSERPGHTLQFVSPPAVPMNTIPFQASGESAILATRPSGAVNFVDHNCSPFSPRS